MCSQAAKPSHYTIRGWPLYCAYEYLFTQNPPTTPNTRRAMKVQGIGQLRYDDRLELTRLDRRIIRADLIETYTGNCFLMVLIILNAKFFFQF